MKQKLLTLIYITTLISSCSISDVENEHSHKKTDKKPKTFGKKFNLIQPATGYKKKIRKFPYYDGVTMIPSFKKGEKVWTPVPVGGDWSIVNYAIATVVTVKESNVYLKCIGSEFIVPGAMIIPLKRPKKRIKKGMNLLVSMGLTSEWGKVQKTGKGEVLVGMVWAKEEVEKAVSLQNLMIMEDKKWSPGSPVVFKTGRKWEFGKLIHRSKTKTWIIGYAGKLEVINNSRVRVVSLSKVYRKKQRIWTPFYDLLEEARIIKRLNNGVGYLVEFTNRPKEKYRNPRTVSFARIVRPLG
jgi:hypothetical protein